MTNSLSLFDADERRQFLPYDGEAWLYPSALADRDDDQIFRQLKNEVDWEQRSIILFGREAPQPRLACWYGDEPYTYSNLTLPARPMTPLLVDLRTQCESISQARFNSVLANLYRDGNDSMGTHSDDEPELGADPVIASLTFGAQRTFRFRHRSTRETIEVPLISGSLLIMRGPTQHCWMHEVPKTKRPVGPRINLTYRFIHHVVR